MEERIILYDEFAFIFAGELLAGFVARLLNLTQILKGLFGKDILTLIML